MFAEFRDLRLDYDSAIRLSRILSIVFLVVVFCLVEGLVRRNLGHDRPLPDLRPFKLFYDLPRNPFLFRIVVKDRRAILCPDICSLPVEGCRIVGCKENSQQVSVRYDTRIKGYLDRLGVTRVSPTNVFVSRIRSVAARVAGFNIDDSFQLVENGLGAPETAPGEGRYL